MEKQGQLNNTSCLSEVYKTQDIGALQLFNGEFEFIPNPG
jgi:hypothetical protein